ncbi:39S ribosomal protein L51, mitochondrial [Thecaphora frezii]
MASRSAATKILRGSLSTIPAPGPAGSPGSFHLPLRKLVIEYCETNPSSAGTRQFLRASVPAWARAHPSVEVVVRQRPSLHPVLRAFYANQRSKEVCVKNLRENGVEAVVNKLRDSSGAKTKSLKRLPVESKAESARGIWSALHGPRF